MSTVRSETSLLIVFTNLSRFAAECSRRPDAEIAEVIDHYYEHVAHAVDGAGGRVVKFIGDGGLAVFSEDAADAGVEMRFRKHTPPVTYLRLEDPRPFRRNRR